MSNSPPPDAVLGTQDHGDDVQRRFRYQASYAAILAVALLDEDSEFKEVFCEHHEDVLVKLTAGFEGVQVKTREAGRGPFKATDAEITGALVRFIRLDREFPSHFVRFAIVSNCGFWKEQKNGSNLAYAIELASAHTDGTRRAKGLRSVVKQLAQASGCDQQSILRLLKKLRVQDGPGLDDIEARLAESLSSCPGLEDLNYQDLAKVAKQLTSTALEAAALSHASPVRDYIALLVNPEQAQADAIISRKRFTVEMVRATLTAARSAPCLIRSRNTLPIADLPKGVDKVGRKMGAGAITPVNIRLTEDHKYSMEHLLSQWLYKLGGARSQTQYEQVATIVHTECETSRDSCRKAEEPYGSVMLSDVRRRLKVRFERDRSLFFDCTFEHLLGIAGILTEECKLWWSDEFDVSGLAAL